MRVVVIGREGQVARALAARDAAGKASITLVGRPDLDLTKPATVEPAIAAHAPDVIVNPAAYTAVEKAEAEPDLAQAINAAGAEAVALAAARLGVPLAHLSTDYVFDGMRKGAWIESDPVSPLGVYGQSKAAGEAVVRRVHADHVILRTAWVYSSHGQNFLKTMLRLAEDLEVMRVVDDQHGTPTSADAIADGILNVCRNLTARVDDELRGTFHMTCSGSATWADFAEAIFEESASLGGPSARVERIGTFDYPTPAKRPANAVLDCRKIAAVHAVALPPWQECAKSTVASTLKTSVASQEGVQQ